MTHSPALFLPLWLLFCLGTLGWGLAALKAARLDTGISRLSERLFYAGLLGLLILGDLFLAAGLAGWLGQGLLASLAGAGIAAGAWAFRHGPRICGTAPHKSDEPFGAGFLILSLPFALIILLHGMIPDSSGDAYLYHITVPNLYAIEGRIQPSARGFCHYYPLQMEMFTMAALRFGQEQAGVLMSALAAMLAWLGLFHAGRRLGGTYCGRAAALAFIALPLTLEWASTSHTDMTSAAFMAGAAGAFIAWRNDGSDRRLLLCGLCAGGAVAAKMIMALGTLLAIPAGIIGAALWNESRCGRLRRTSRALAIYAGGAALPMLPWLLKNSVFAYNPFFPFLLNVFPTRTDLLYSARVLHEMHGIPPLLPLAKTLERLRGLPGLIAWNANWTILAALILTPAGMWMARRRREIRGFWTITGIMCLIVVYYGKNAQIRWFGGFYAFLILGISLLAAETIRGRTRLRPWITALGAGFILLAGARFIILRAGDTGLSLMTGLSREKSLKYREEMSGFHQAALINRIVPETGRIFLYHEEILSPGRHLKRPFVQAGVLWFNAWEEAGMGPDEIFEEMRRLGVTHFAECPSNEHKVFRAFEKRHLARIPEAGYPAFYALREGED